ncbi:hypothetical protein C9I56_33510 [Paraburkholderia caribensis]|uniref:Uncharacterized protein n=1 Tax=Paraburkholderia caribensis TaxID=75105 RepID=A0A9Q6RZ84_9BURK|nr:hypothetical protein C9I56_33510 [Paraburkholderia caribensis]QLB61614.1 hypothetical protein A9O66_03970 [Paraburkholderia caribensis]
MMSEIRKLNVGLVSRSMFFEVHGLADPDASRSGLIDTMARLSVVANPCRTRESRESRGGLSVVSRDMSTSLASLSLPLGERLARLETRDGHNGALRRLIQAGRST